MMEEFLQIILLLQKYFLLNYKFCRHWHIINILWIKLSVLIASNADKLSCIVVYTEASTLSICYKFLDPQKADKHQGRTLPPTTHDKLRVVPPIGQITRNNKK